MAQDRRESAYAVRVEAAESARRRTHPEHTANPDEQRYAAAHYPMSFTKGLDHNSTTGLVSESGHFESFRNCIDEGWIEPFTSRVPVPTGDCPRRQWEAPTAGVVFDLEGPDAQAVTMPPAPELCSSELAYEMAEVYELALLRDVPLESFDTGGGTDAGKIDDAVNRLNALDYTTEGFSGRPRKTVGGQVTRQTAFRGSSPGVEVGPYLSQFLIMGNDTLSGKTVKDGFIGYGAQVIDQRVPMAIKHQDHMQTWDDWLTVQKGFDVNKCGLGKNTTECGPGQNFTGKPRFICTPRDLATYVHYDALYQAYLNATLILLGMGTPFDPGFAKLSGMRDMYNPPAGAPTQQNAGGFALYGPPHILTLVTEVATRALKAVRYQKFNNHLRLRPEALAARIEKAALIDKHHPSTCGAFTKLHDQVGKVVHAVKAKNKEACGVASALLPMAFAEGSPMHPTYGAGHATVAGACTTLVKAFFDCGTILGTKSAPPLKKGQKAPCGTGGIGFHRAIDDPVCFAPKKKKADEYYDTLDMKTPDKPLTLEGELNKLAANISIGRNMAGVHYFSDYYDSLRMGEEIAIGMLQEQALCYPTDEFVLTIPTFDGGSVRIGAR
ncbi:MAG: vanadium-dependent haloperoxidase [Pseudomonadota bacterium]